MARRGRLGSIPLVSFHDPSRQLTELLRQRGGEDFTSLSRLNPGSFAERVVVGEAPLFSSRPDGIDPHLDPTKVDLWAYSYRSVQRPSSGSVKRSGKTTIPSPYWRFDDRYADQIGVGAHGDLPGEIKVSVWSGRIARLCARPSALRHPRLPVCPGAG